MVYTVIRHFCQNLFSCHLGENLEFLCKTQKHNYLENGVRFSMKCFTLRGCAESYVTFCQKKVFTPFLVAFLNFCVKQQNFLHPGYLQSHLELFIKNVFPPYWATILNFCIKHKNTFTSKMVLGFQQDFGPSRCTQQSLISA